MTKLKDIEKELRKYVSESEINRSENGQKLIILSCAIGDNFYDYGEAPKVRMDASDLPKELQDIVLNDNRIQICMCEDCCGCAGW